MKIQKLEKMNQVKIKSKNWEIEEAQYSRVQIIRWLTYSYLYHLRIGFQILIINYQLSLPTQIKQRN
jgi:hypothetical protein